MTKEKIVYFDLDGVLADFDLGIYRESGIYRTELTNDKAWEYVNKNNQFFANLPPTDLVYFFRKLYKNGYNLGVLTATGNNYTSVASQKMLWCNEHLGVPPRSVHIVKSGKDKVIWAEPNALLIDDTLEVVRSWVSAEGKAIWHKNPYPDIRKIKTQILQFFLNSDPDTFSLDL